MAGGKGREYEFTFRLDGEMDPDLKKALGQTSSAMNEIEKELKQLNGANPFKDLGKDARKVEREIKALEGATGGFRDTLRTVAEYTGAFALIGRVTDSIKGVVGTLGEYENSLKQIQAATGMTAQDMGAIEKTVKSLYNQNLGESFTDLSSAVTAARQATQAQGDELELLTKNAIVYRDVFGEDIRESIKASDTMMRNFGVSAEEAYNLLAQGAQNGLDKSGDLLDTANGYSVYFKTLGYTAEDMFNQLGAGMEAGAFNLDKVGDAVKEFGIRIKDGSDSTAEALAMLFAPDGIEEYTQALMTGTSSSAAYMELLQHVSKDTAAQLVKDLKAGGRKSEAAYQTLQSIMGGGNKMLADLSSGAIQGRNAMQQVIDKLNEIQDPIQRSTIGVALFGTQFEDMEAGVIASLGTTRKQFDMTKQTMEEVAAVKYDSLSNDFRKIGRELMTEFVMPITEDLMPALEGVAAWIGDNRGLIENLALIVPGAMAAKGAAKMVGAFGKIDAAAKVAAGGVGAAGKSVSLLGSAVGLLGGPVGIGITALSALTFGVMEYKRHQEAARDALLNMGVSVEKAYANYRSVTEHSKKVDALIGEYDRLNAKIKDSRTPTAELETARSRLLEVEKELIDLNPDILRAEDAKSGKFREQLDLVQRMNKVRTETEKRTLEKSFIDNNSQLAALEKEYKKLVSDVAKYDFEYKNSRESYAKYSEYVNRQQAIVSNPSISSEEMQKQLNDLAKEIEAVTGKFYGFNWSSLAFETADFKKTFNAAYDNWMTTTKEIEAADQSFQKSYATSKAYIESNLGGTIEETAKKFNLLSDSGKAAFNDALRKLADLNKAMDLLPNEKKVNVKVLYEQTGQQMPASQMTLQDMPIFPDFSKFSLPGFAKGGFSRDPAVFGEAGLEAAIPIDGSARSLGLWEQTGHMLGAFDGWSMSAPADYMAEPPDAEIIPDIRRVDPIYLEQPAMAPITDYKQQVEIPMDFPEASELLMPAAKSSSQVLEQPTSVPIYPSMDTEFREILRAFLDLEAQFLSTDTNKPRQEEHSLLWNEQKDDNEPYVPELREPRFEFGNDIIGNRQDRDELLMWQDVSKQIADAFRGFDLGFQQPNQFAPSISVEAPPSPGFPELTMQPLDWSDGFPGVSLSAPEWLSALKPDYPDVRVQEEDAIVDPMLGQLEPPSWLRELVQAPASIEFPDLAVPEEMRLIRGSIPQFPEYPPMPDLGSPVFEPFISTPAPQFDFARPVEEDPRLATLEALLQQSSQKPPERGGNISITYSPNITIQGGGADAREQVGQALKADRADFERWYREMQRDERRLSFR